MKQHQLTSTQVQQFCASLAILLKAGISLQEGFTVIEENEPQLQPLIQILKQELKQGADLHQAMAATGQFPLYALHMTEIAETYGNLDRVMEALAKYYEREHNLQEQLHHAIRYPFILLLMMFVVVGVLLFKVLPIFHDVLSSLNTSSVGSTSSLMSVGTLLARIGFGALLLVLLLIVFFYFKQTHQKGSTGWARFLSSFVMTKKLYTQMSMGQMTYAFTLFLNSGGDMLQGTEMLKGMITHPNIRNKLDICIQQMQQGDSFAMAIREAHVYEGMEASMLEVGFLSGQGDEIMATLANSYEQRVESDIADFLNIIEPTIVALLSVLVGLLLLSVMLPLMSIMTSL